MRRREQNQTEQEMVKRTTKMDDEQAIKELINVLSINKKLVELTESDVEEVKRHL